MAGCAIVPRTGEAATPARACSPIPSTVRPTPTQIPTATSPLRTATTVPPTASPTQTPSPSPTSTTAAEPTALAGTSSPGAPIYTYRIVDAFPHDPGAFTQGLVFDGGLLYEGTGLYGASSLREVELETGRVIRSIALPDDLFGEGIAVLGDKIVQLTWHSNLGLVYDRQTFEVLGEFTYPTEGWGLAYDGEQLVMSDGTSTLHFLDPETFEEVRRTEVHEGATLIGRLNELEFVDGLLLANAWATDFIVMIDPGTGEVAGWIDLAGLLDQVPLEEPVGVLNGIAYDRASGRLFVTGKLWPLLFQIELVELAESGTGR